MSDYDQQAYVRGVRAFALDGDRLASPVWSEPSQYFVPGPNEAICAIGLPGVLGVFSSAYHPRHEPAPASRCSCGLYACHDMAALTRRFQLDVTSSKPQVVRAAVRMWGDIDVHADGCRAQWMEVVALAAADDVERAALSSVAAAYGVPVVDEARLDDVAAEHGQRAPAVDDAPARRMPGALAHALAALVVGVLCTGLLWLLPAPARLGCFVGLVILSMWYLFLAWSWAGRPLDWRYTSGDPLPSGARRRRQRAGDP